jgi:hypothetical protein
VTRWADFEAGNHELAGRVRAILTSRKHHTMATLRRDGAPRVSGLEVAFDGGDLVVGMMPDSVKLADVRRDPRVALHALSDDPPEGDPGAWTGDVKLAGRLVEQTADADVQPPGPRFWFDITEVVLTHLDPAATLLEIESWHPERGLQVMHRV